MPDPIYTPATCAAPAYQLDWSYSLFWRAGPTAFEWLDELRHLSEKDHIRILQHEFREPNVSKFLVSTRPAVAPLRIAQRVKGRLQHLIGSPDRSPFRRNYALRSIGSTRRDRLEQYLAAQLNHHRMADADAAQRLKQYQVHRPEVRLSEPRRTSHAQYWYNLHVVMVADGRHMEIRDEVLGGLRDMILAVSDAKGHWLSRGAIVADPPPLRGGGRLGGDQAAVVQNHLPRRASSVGTRRCREPCSAESSVPPSKLGGDKGKAKP